MTDDTNDIESLLSEFRPVGPDAALRGRVARQTRGRSRWAFWEAMAAMLLIGMNLSQISASITHLLPAKGNDESRTRQMASAIASLDLPLSPDEVQTMAFRLSAGERLILLPVIHGDHSIVHANYGALP